MADKQVALGAGISERSVFGQNGPVRVNGCGSLVVAVLLLASCDGSGIASSDRGRVASTSTTASPPTSPVENCRGEPVDLVHRRPAAAGDQGYEYHQVLKSDLDRDGTDETAHLIASLKKVGEDDYGHDEDDYGWEDGHAWHLYVEEPDGHRTYLFSDWVQFGTLDVHLISPSDSTLAIQHDSANAFGLYCAEYLGPGKVRSTELAGYTPSGHHFTWAN
jgi:hypothetical protein